jgi:aminoglycoside phosphotransferase family enzyme
MSPFTHTNASSMERLENKVRSLRQADTYPDKPSHIDAVETHMSWVFLTDRFAYKMKKPVRYDFLDFSTLSLRQRDCEEEVRLNQRLAPDVYLGTVSLTVNSLDQARINGDGDIVEWLVKMRRLPRERMLDHLIGQKQIDETDIRNLGKILAEFYATSTAVERSVDRYKADIEQAVNLNRDLLLTPDYELPADAIRALHDTQLQFLQQESHLLDARVESGRIIEGHGDLRPEHVCLEPRPVIIDCLEFNRQFRIIDPVDELSFLAVECELLGAPAIGEQILRIYEELSGDRPSRRLVLFYKIYRACLRARLAISHVKELEKHDWPKWQARAGDYLRLAESHRVQLQNDLPG